jgi:hypothetical protein
MMHHTKMFVSWVAGPIFLAKADDHDQETGWPSSLPVVVLHSVLRTKA